MSRKKAKKRVNLSEVNGYQGIIRSLSTGRLEQIFDNFKHNRIVIVGDIMLDRYLWGDCSRISPEAPVPVVEIDKEEHLLGGAANVANNIAAMDGKAELVGVVGKDIFARDLKTQLKSKSFGIDGVFPDTTRPTTVKTRIIAQNQQVVRADREKTHEISTRLNNRAIGYIESIIEKVSAVIISDYGKGVINAALLDRLISICIGNDIFVAVDPKQTHFFNYRKVSTITPNHHEASFAAGKKIIDDASLEEVGWKILERLEARSLLVTLGAQGMALFENGQINKSKRSLTRIPTMARKVYDVTGAGDTVIATMTMAVAAGATLREAAFIANVAAGEVVAQIGTAQVERQRLKDLIAEFVQKSTS
jgi:D-beta-D-heptose 7-phosphate kinase/D-beta-D-heptose 1-phosphate adenosyltransferase